MTRIRGRGLYHILRYCSNWDPNLNHRLGGVKEEVYDEESGRLQRQRSTLKLYVPVTWHAVVDSSLCVSILDDEPTMSMERVSWQRFSLLWVVSRPIVVFHISCSL